MLYRRSLDIERRLTAILALIQKGGFSTPMIAEEIGVSIPTVSRAVTALRQRGHKIRAEKIGQAWRYVFLRPLKAASRTESGLLTGVTP